MLSVVLVILFFTADENAIKTSLDTLSIEYIDQSKADEKN